MKRSRRIFSSILAFVLVAYTLGSTMLTSFAGSDNTSTDLSKYLNVYEDFESFDNDSNPYTFNWLEPSYGSAATATIETQGSNKWLKVSGNNAAGHHYMEGDNARTDFSGKISEHDGIAAYVKADTAATFNFMFGMHNQNARTRTFCNSNLEYTLVTKDSKKTVASANGGVPLPAGFEGWVILGYDELTGAGGWNDAFKGIKSVRGEGDYDLKWINYMVPEITNASGAVYVDNISFVKECKSFIDYLVPPTLNDYLNVYENFESYAEGNTSYALDYVNDAFGTANTATIEKRADSNKWLKIGGNNGAGHKYVSDIGTAREDVSGKPGDYDGFATYVSTRQSATFNIRFQFSYGYMTRTAMNSALPYTLITKDGKKTTGTGVNGVPLPAEFEGWVIIKTADFTAAGGYEEAFSSIAAASWWNNIGFLNQMAVEITDATAPVYVDDIAFVTKSEDMIKFLEKDTVTPEPTPTPTPTPDPEPEPTPEPEPEPDLDPVLAEHLAIYETFNSLKSGSTYKMDYTEADGGQFVATATVETKSGDDKWVKLSGNNRAGHIYDTPKAGFSANVADYKGAAVYVKAEKSAVVNLLMKSPSGLTRTLNNNDLKATLISKTGRVTDISGGYGVTVPAEYEGWVVFEKSQLTNGGGWETGALDNITDLNEISVYTVEVTETKGAFWVDNFAFVKNPTAFANALKKDNPDPEPEPEINPSDYLTVYDDFNAYTADSKFTLDYTDADGGQYVANATIKKRSNGNNWLKLSGNNRAGHTYEVPRVQASGNPQNHDGVALYIKTETSATINVLLKSEGLTRTLNNKELAYNLVRKDGTLVQKTAECGVPVPAGFEGWLVLTKRQLTNAPGWPNGAFDNLGDLNQIKLYTVEVTDTNGAVYVDDLSFVTDTMAFLNAISKTAPKEDPTPTPAPTPTPNPDPILRKYLAIYEDYNSLKNGSFLSMDYTEADGGQFVATAKVEKRSKNDYWIKLSGNNRAGHIYATPKTTLSGKVSDYKGAAVYVKAEKSAVLNLLIKSPGGLTRTVSNENLKATLISKTGRIMKVSGSYGVTIPAAYEGWVVFEKSQLTNGHGWETGALDNITDLNEISVYTVEVTETKGAFWVDNFAFVNNPKGFANALKKDNPAPEPVPVIEPSDYLTVYDDFNAYKTDSKFTLDYTDADGGQYVANATIKKRASGNNWLKLSGNNRAGHTYEVPRVQASGNPANHDGIAFYIKTEKSATINVLLKSEGLTRTLNNKELAYNLVRKDGTLVQKTAECGVPVPAGFEGWLVLTKRQLTNAPGWPNGAFDNLGDLNQISLYTIEVTDTNGAVYVDDLSFVTDTMAFLTAIAKTKPKEEPKPQPTLHEQAYKSGYQTADKGNVLYFENFDSWTSKYNYELDFTDMDPNNKSSYSVVNRNGKNRWLKITGYSIWGHRYADDGMMRLGTEANIADYDGFSMYVKTTESATFNLLLAMGGTARFTTQTATNLKYTLIYKDGTTQVAEIKYGAGGVALPAGFEGWIVLDKSQFEAPMGWPAEVADWGLLPNGDIRWLNFFVPYVQTTGDFYFDNLGFVKSVDKFVSNHADKVIKPLTAKTAGNQIVLENFEKNPSNAYEEASRLKLAKRTSDNTWWLPKVADESGFMVVNSPITPEIGFTGFSMYIETMKDTSIALFLNKNETSFRTTVTGKVNYTLVNTDGTYRDVTVNDGYIKIKAGFKGYLVIDKNMFTNAGWGEKNLTMNSVKASEITKFYTYLSLGVDGKDKSDKIGIDDICFVQDTAKLRSELTNGKYVSGFAEAGDAKGDGTSYILEDFSEMPVGNLDSFYSGLTIGEETEEGGIKIVEDKDGNKWWQQTKKGSTGFMTAYKAPKSVGTDWDGIAFYVKVDMKEATDMSMSLGGVLHFRMLNAFPNAKEPYTTANFSTQNAGMNSSMEYTFIDTKKNQILYQNMGGIQFDNACEGWIYVDKKVLTDTWLDNRPMDTITADKIDSFVLGFSQFNQGEVNIREVRLVSDKDGFFEKNAKPADLVYEFEYDSIEVIPAKDFEYIKKNDIAMHITINDGYPIYEWTFNGADVDTPADFDPTVLCDDEIMTIDDKTELATFLASEQARAFSVNALPGKATLAVSSGLKYEYEQELTLYRYDETSGASEKVSEDVYVVNEADMIELAVTDEGVYYFLPTDVTLDGENADTAAGTGMTPLQTILVVLGIAVLAGGIGGGAYAFIRKKKASSNK